MNDKTIKIDVSEKNELTPNERNLYGELKAEKIYRDMFFEICEYVFMKEKDYYLVSSQKEIHIRKSFYEEMKSKILFIKAVETACSSILIGDMAKILKQNGIDIGQNRLFQWLRNNGFLCNKKGKMYNMPTQKAMNLALFEIKEGVVKSPSGDLKITKTPIITGKGQKYLMNIFLKDIYVQE